MVHCPHKKRSKTWQAWIRVMEIIYGCYWVRIVANCGLSY